MNPADWIRSPFRIGHGYDIHRYAANRPMILGGVQIPCDFGLHGHSDADCLSHALADAILGALALPDIGHYFPNHDPAIAGIDSQKILARAVAEAKERGYSVGNVDLTVVAQMPKIAPHVEAIRHKLAATLQVAPNCVGIKATTNEKLGAIGRQEGLAAFAVVLLFAQECAVRS